MFNKLETSPIKVAILDISPKNKAVLEFFFKNAGKSLFKLSAINEADAFIIDYDFPSAKENWEARFAEVQKPVIIFSFKETNVPSSVYVAKPITAKALTEAGTKLKELIASATTLKEPEEITKTVSEKPADVVVSSEANIESVGADELTATSALKNEADISSEKVSVKDKELAFTGTSYHQSESESESESESASHSGDASTNISDEALAKSKPVDAGEALDSQVDSTESDNLSFNQCNINTTDDSDKTELSDISAEINQASELDSLLDELSADLPVENLDEVLENEANNAEEINLADEKFPKLENVDSSSDDLSEELPKENLEENQESVETSDNLFGDIKAASVVQSAAATNASELIIEDSDEASSEDEIEELLRSIQEKTDDKDEGQQAATAEKGLRPERVLTKAEKRWALLCGELSDIASKDDLKEMPASLRKFAFKQKLNTISFDSKSHAISHFLSAIKQAKERQEVIHMSYAKRTMIIDHVLNCVYCDSSIMTDSFAKFCADSSSQSDLKMTVVTDEDEIKSYRKTIGLSLDTTYSFEQFIWTASLLTSRGRLPQQINITNKVTLKHWPDLTRLEQIPHAIRIAAVLYKHPGNLLEVAHWLHIPERYVFAFYNGVLALEMVKSEEVKIESVAPSSLFEIDNSAEKTENRGLFSRLLNKLGS